MSNIQTYLDELANALYGEEVRSSIINAINQCYQDATEGMRPEFEVTAITNGKRVTIRVGNETDQFDLYNGGNTELKTAQFHSTAQTFPAFGQEGATKQVYITNIFGQESYQQVADYDFLCVVGCWSSGAVCNVYTTATSINSDDNGKIGLWCTNMHSQPVDNVTIYANILFWKQVEVAVEEVVPNP